MRLFVQVCIKKKNHEFLFCLNDWARFCVHACLIEFQLPDARETHNKQDILHWLLDNKTTTKQIKY